MRIDGTDRCTTGDDHLGPDAAEAEPAVAMPGADDRLRRILAAIDVGYSLCEIVRDAAGQPVDWRFVEVNPTFERFTGFRDVVGRHMRDVSPVLRERWIETVGRVGLGGETLRFRSADIALDRVFSVTVTPIAPRGRFAVLLLDATEQQHRDEETPGPNEALLRAFFDNSTSHAFAKDLQGRYIFANRYYLDAFGIDDFETLRGRTDRDRFGAAEPYSANDLRVVAEGRPIVFEESAVVADGRRIYAISTKFPLRDRDGRITGVGSISTDITERKEAEEQRKFLLAELDHRVKNTLALVQSIAHQTFKADGHPGDAVKSFNGRLRALAASHDILTRENWIKADLAGLVVDVLHACGVEPARASLDGPLVDLTPKQAINLTLALHELCTNASKYGALSGEAGRVIISWGGAGGLPLTWREEGGPPVAVPARFGFGLRMIENVLRTDFDADVVFDFRADGFGCRVTPRATSADGEGGS